MKWSEGHPFPQNVVKQTRKFNSVKWTWSGILMYQTKNIVKQDLPKS